MTVNSICNSTFTCGDTKQQKVNNYGSNDKLFCYGTNFSQQSTNVSQEENSEKGLFSNFLDLLSKLFNPNRTGKRSGIEIPVKSDGLIYYVEEPDTPEFKARNEYMNNKVAEWNKDHPEPEMSSSGFLCNSQHFQWMMEKQKYVSALETIYREENPEYKAQALDYEDIKRQVSTMM